MLTLTLALVLPIIHHLEVPRDTTKSSTRVHAVHSHSTAVESIGKCSAHELPRGKMSRRHPHEGSACHSRALNVPWRAFLRDGDVHGLLARASARWGPGKSPGARYDAMEMSPGARSYAMETGENLLARASARWRQTVQSPPGARCYAMEGLLARASARWRRYR